MFDQAMYHSDFRFLRGPIEPAASTPNQIGVPSGRDSSGAILILHFDTHEHLCRFYHSPELTSVRFGFYLEILMALRVEIDMSNERAVESAIKALERAGTPYISRSTYADKPHPAAWNDLMQAQNGH